MYKILSKIKRGNENAGKPKELWETLRKVGAPSKEPSMSTISKKDGKILFDSKSNLSCFNKFVKRITNANQPIWDR